MLIDCTHSGKIYFQGFYFVFFSVVNCGLVKLPFRASILGKKILQTSLGIMYHSTNLKLLPFVSTDRTAVEKVKRMTNV